MLFVVGCAATLSISVGQWRGECGWRQTPIPNFRPAPLPPETPASYNTKIFLQNSQWVASTASELKSNLQMFSTFLAMDNDDPIQSKLIPSVWLLMFIIYLSKVFLWPLIYQQCWFNSDSFVNLQFSVCDNWLNYLISDGRKLIIWLPWINKTLLFQYQVSGDVVSEKQNKIFFFDKRGKDQNMKSVLANNHKWVQLYTYTVSLMTLIDEMHLNILWQLVRSWRQGCPSWLTSFWLFPQSPWVQKAWH